MLNNESMEMYLETILRLCKSNEKVRAVDIANQMRISKVSVCHAIKNLQAKDYVDLFLNNTLVLLQSHHFHLFDDNELQVTLRNI